MTLPGRQQADTTDEAAQVAGERTSHQALACTPEGRDIR
jgi:hypothetical protein